jgi:adenylate kinase
LICYGEGENVLPTIHLDDLVKCIVQVAEVKPEKKFILAVDNSKNKLFDILKVSSRKS